MSSDRELNLALFLDFDNVAIGARDARQRFDIHVVLERLLEKGKIVVKKAYADWSYYQDYMQDLHQAAIELIEVPSPRMSGKNSADIRMVVDAMDLCYSKDHIDAFVLVSGDSDFSPLVSKLRENDKGVIGVGMKGSSSNLLIANCDEFIFYDDLTHGPVAVEAVNMESVPADKKKLFNLLVATIEGLVREHKGPLYSSLIKDTMKRKKPDFNERAWGYSSFSDLLEEAMAFGVLTAERDEKAGGTFVVTALGGEPGPLPVSNGARRPSRRRRRRSGRGDDAPRKDEAEKTETTETVEAAEGADKTEAPAEDAPRKKSSRRRRRPSDKPVEEKKGAEKKTEEKAPAEKPAEEKPAAKKKAAKKTTKKAATKKTTAKKAPAKKSTTKKAATRKTAAKKAPAKKAATKKTSAKKTTTKKAATKKTTAKKAPAKKTTAKKTAKKATTKKTAKKPAE